MTDDIYSQAGLMDWDHRDPFNRIIAATAIASNMAPISADPIFDDLATHAGWPGRIW